MLTIIYGMVVGIIGNGYVGRATAMLVGDTNALVYDVNPALSRVSGGLVELVRESELVFVCVPTPELADGGGVCDTSIVDGVIDQVREIRSDAVIVVRSTVPIGYCRGRGVMFFPEFLTERNWEHDVRTCGVWLLGGGNLVGMAGVIELIRRARVEGRIESDLVEWREVADTVEAIKYMRNAFLATKVAFFNEMEMFCASRGMDWSAVREGVLFDGRVGESHTQVPGPDGRWGFGGTCLPKDTASLAHQMGPAAAVVLRAVLDRNGRLDRPRCGGRGSN